MERHFYALLPDQSVSDLTDELRKRYYPRSLNLHPPHITLVPPFQTDEAAKLWQEVTRISRTQKRLQLQLEGLGVFAHRQNVLHLRVARNEELTNYRSGLVNAAGIQPTWHEFSPHLSIGKLTDEQVARAMAELADQNLQTSFTGERVVDFQEKEDGGWEAVRELKLT